jgi:hypothetical protein
MPMKQEESKPKKKELLDDIDLMLNACDNL